MEDFSTILWVVIIVGAMIYNSLSKARKTRGKEGNNPSGHGEAWPSIPWNNEDTAPQSSETATTSRIPTSIPTFENSPQTGNNRSPISDANVPTPRTTTAPNGHSSVLRKETDRTPRSNIERGLQTEFDRKAQPQDPDQLPYRETRRNPIPSSECRQTQTPVPDAVPDEYQSLEEISIEEYIPEYETAETSECMDFDCSMTRNNISGDLKQKAEGEPAFPKPPGKSTRKGQENITELVEEFDLRRAVIYSEILKPKFED